MRCAESCANNERNFDFVANAGAVVGVRVRSTVPVHVEEAVVEVLVIVAATVKARVRRVEVPVIARNPQGSHRKPRYSTPVSDFYLRGGQTPSYSPLWELHKAGAEAGARARSTEPAHEEEAVVEALVIVAATVKARVRRAEAPVIARICRITSICG